jgi:hypothetical protein
MCQIESLEMTLTLYDLKPHPLKVFLICYQQRGNIWINVPHFVNKNKSQFEHHDFLLKLMYFEELVTFLLE